MCWKILYIYIYKFYIYNFIYIYIFPSFYEHDKILVAKFSDLRHLYHKGCKQLIKLAPKENFKTIFPSTLDRQKVSLINNISK